MKSVIVTGGSGFLAQHLIRLIRDAITVTAVDVRRESQQALVDCDVTDFEAVSKLFNQVKADVVVHLAAITGVERCRLKPYESFLVNVLGTYNVAYMSALNKKKLVFASSREVYGETGQTRTNETADLRPRNLYGLTKMLAESLIHWMHVSMGLPYVILRFTNLYGPGGDQYAVAAIAKNALKHAEIPVFGGNQVLNLIHVHDAARAIEICLTAPNLENDIFNIGSDDTVKVTALIDQIISLSGSQSKRVQLPMRSEEINFFLPDLSKARAKLGFEPQITLEHGLVDCIEYYRSHKLQT